MTGPPKNGSSQNRLRVLLIEDSPSDAEIEIAELRRAGFDVSADVVDNRQRVRDRLKKNVYDIILADYSLPDFRGMDALDILREMNLTTPLILVTGALNSETAVECVKQGAMDYVLKDHLARLPISVRRSQEDVRVRQERARAQDQLANKVEELARSNCDLEQFAYVASHDLQEPLRMVAAYTQLLAERYQGKLDSAADRYISYAVEGATRMQALLEDLLAFSRVGRNGVVPAPTDANSAVDESLKNLALALKEHNVTVTCNRCPRFSPIIFRLCSFSRICLAMLLSFAQNKIPVSPFPLSKRAVNGCFRSSTTALALPKNTKTWFSRSSSGSTPELSTQVMGWD